MGIPRVNRWLLALAVALQPGLAAAQASHVSLTIDEHGVTLDAREATIGAILQEWERVGGIKVMAPETLNDGPVTLQLTNVPEREAFDILLRGAGGYVLGPRTAGTVGASQFGMLVLVPPGAQFSQIAAAAFNRSATQTSAPVVGLILPAPAAQTDTEADQPEQTGERAASDLTPDADSPESTAPLLADRPPPDLRTPIQRPSAAPDALNPFGKPGGAATPGTILTGAAPTGFLYPSNALQESGGQTPGEPPPPR
jgi:hypothetical protein